MKLIKYDYGESSEINNEKVNKKKFIYQNNNMDKIQDKLSKNKKKKIKNIFFFIIIMMIFIINNSNFDENFQIRITNYLY